MKEDLPPWSDAAKQLKPGGYRHFNGGEYEALGVAHHSETFEELVVYRHLDGTQGFWVRPLMIWNERVERDGYSGPRFQYVGDK